MPVSKREVQILLKRYLERPELFAPLPARQTSQDLQQSGGSQIIQAPSAARQACEVGFAVDVVQQELSGGCPTSRKPCE
ncbi:hypothetical protein P5673_030305 [Acropora cervicornis]|uniref:Uncharacterized protein n=1 Tax=Acropora cervicornis TaxID=6130 RepID=A0AAD9PUH6_ACRCE|nr:hypothetical protein P5673_030305 [Acropora cervicornis]